MRRGLACIGALLLSACATAPHPPVPCAADPQRCAAIGDSAADYDDTYRVFIRIQSDLDRVAAGQSRRAVPAGATRDPMENLVDAYAAYLRGDEPGMDKAIVLALDGAAADARPLSRWDADAYAAYDAQLAEGIHADRALPRLVAALRSVDERLYRDLYGGHPMERNDSGMRTDNPSPEAGLWLRLPCRTLRDHAAAFIADAPALRRIPGPLLDCPSDDGAIATLAGLADAPRRLAPHQSPVCPDGIARDGNCHPPRPEPSPPEPPSAREVARNSMAAHPDAAEAVLKQAAAEDLGGKLDYVLFLHAFRPRTPARDASIRSMLDEIQGKAYARRKPDADFEVTTYDGSDQSLVPRIILASMGDDQSAAQYAIPCEVLKARPSLVEAVQSHFGSNLDNFLPRSGCVTPDGFPAAAVGDFRDGATLADGHFIDNFEGSMVYGFETHIQAVETAMQVYPASFLSPQEPAGEAYPYQDWGYLGLGNYRTSLRLKTRYEKARQELADYYATLHLSREQALQAARNALFALVFGADCGPPPAADSPRVLLLQQASLAAIEQALDRHHKDADLPEACSRNAGIDPLMLIAAGAYPKALDALLAHGATVSDTNSIGKTPLMEAAQLDQPQSVAWLLKHAANPNATTWPASKEKHFFLGHDARTALMYAAANASLRSIEHLLAAGADPYQTDSKGYRAIDYLLGYGPTPPNPGLSRADRLKAQALLY